jgi:hypothetical protein
MPYFISYKLAYIYNKTCKINHIRTIFLHIRSQRILSQGSIKIIKAIDLSILIDMIIIIILKIKLCDLSLKYWDEECSSKK